MRRRQARAAAAPEQSRVSPELTSTLDHLTTAILKEFPDFATTLAVSEDIAGGKYSDRLPDLSSEGVWLPGVSIDHVRQQYPF